MTHSSEQDTIVIYETPHTEVDIKLSGDTLWLNQKKMADIFDTSTDNIGLHLKNIYQEGELEETSTTEESSVVQKEGNRTVKRRVKLYNLDAIIAVGYRVNSKKATAFRQWSTKIIKNHLVKGYTINKHRIQTHYQQFLQAVSDVKNLLSKDMVIDNNAILELITMFADTWLSLDAYDKDQLVAKGSTKKHVLLTAEKLCSALLQLKSSLIAKQEATELFGTERTKDSIAGIIGNVMQSFSGADVYPSIEEKAANLLYFIIKNHPFVDGNKRSGAYAFIWYLRQAGILDVTRITPPALTALTLLIAESAPKDKDRLVALVCTIISRGENIVS